MDSDQIIFGLRFGRRFKLVSDVVSGTISEQFADVFSVSCRSSLPDSLRAVFLVAFGPTTRPLKRVSGRSGSLLDGSEAQNYCKMQHFL